MGCSSSRFSCYNFETYYGDEIENQSFNQRKDCKKSEYHKFFINVREFEINRLPETFPNERIFRLVHLLADLTVKIKIDYVSEDRTGPKNLNYRRHRFPLIDYLGKKTMHNGSGRIWDIFPINEKPEYDNVTCPCSKCDGKQNKNVWIAKVYTATHVVFDTIEAKKTECILFYDSRTMRQDIKLYGLKAIWKHNEGDLCILYCVTCDETLAETIRGKFLELCLLWQELETPSGDNEKEKLAVIVSHPHGWPKKIYVGEWESRVEVNKDMKNEHRYTYKHSVSTCSGSSGGHVFILGSRYLHSAYCHSRTSKRENFSSCWRYKDESSNDKEQKE